MSEIEKCRCGGCELKLSPGPCSWRCKNPFCGIEGPANDRDGDKWNSLMRAARERDELREQVERLKAIIQKNLDALPKDWTDEANCYTETLPNEHTATVVADQSVEPTEVRNCGTCRWYSKKGHKEGECHRYPKNSWKAQDNFCGEWAAKEVRQ